MKKQTFEQYLEEQWFKQYHGHKKDAEDAYAVWLENLDGQDYIKYAQQWGDILTF